MGEASPIGFVLGTKPASSLKFHASVILDELNKYTPRDGHSPVQDILLDIAVPVLINSSLPAWVTHGEEVDDQDLDKAARDSMEKSECSSLL